MEREKITAAQAKGLFLKSLFKLISDTVKKTDESAANGLSVEGSSIFYTLPDNFFKKYEIPSDTTIEIKLISKRSK